MSVAALPRGRPTAVELTNDAHFATRVRRLVVVSATALGVIFLLASGSSYTDVATTAALGIGWVSMPLVLAFSLLRPRLRYLLVFPAVLVSIGLLSTAVSFSGSAVATLGWWLMTGGVWLGACLGGWFWYRWAPVPGALDDPFSIARWTLVIVHAGVITIGASLVASTLPG